MTLVLSKKGYSFIEEDQSDLINLDNHRYVTEKRVRGKDGNYYFLEFTNWDKTYQVSKMRKKDLYPHTRNATPEQLKHFMNISTEYDCKDGLSRRNCYFEEYIHMKGLMFTKENILLAVNILSKNYYDKIKIID